MKPLTAVWIGTAFLLAYTLVIHLTNWQNLAFFLYFLSPFVVIWMVVKVLKGEGPEVAELFPYS